MRPATVRCQLSFLLRRDVTILFNLIRCFQRRAEEDDDDDDEDEAKNRGSDEEDSEEEV